MTFISTPPHQFHIPVMGTGFTIDTPLRVARFGISSVVSIGDDHLIEEMRGLHSRRAGLPFVPIKTSETDSRARRIRAYLDLLHDLVEQQFTELRDGSFDTPGELTRYFDYLPEGALKDTYRQMRDCTDASERVALQADLRRRMVAGRIDVNIMAKVDGEHIFRDGSGEPIRGIARTALRGFATSKLCSRVVLSAGLNKKLLANLADFPDFMPVDGNRPKKGVTIKVSDYRSAFLQGKILARHGVWVSEFRVESGLNCGGHAFATVGELMGPILEEFRLKKQTLHSILMDIYAEALEKTGRKPWGGEEFEVSAQGGAGTNEEQNLLLGEFKVDSVGWGTPFLLVPEATNVDAAHLRKLADAGEDDVMLSSASPLGLPFWMMKNSDSETNRKRLVSEGRPGSKCPKSFLAADTQFTEVPICRASRVFQKRKLAELSGTIAEHPNRESEIDEVLSKACLCADLAAGALKKNGLDTDAYTAVCCGPGIVDFNRVATLSEMIDHIYGRISLLSNADRPHMFIRELSQYVSYLADQTARKARGMSDLPEKYFEEFRANLLKGIAFYRETAERLKQQSREPFLAALEAFENRLALALAG